LRKRSDLAGRQMPPRTWGQASQTDAADADANQAGDSMAERRHHPAHLTVTAFIDGQLYFPLPCAVGVLLAAQQADVLGRLRHAVIQHDAATQTPKRIFAGNARHGDAVRLGNMVTRVRHLKQKVAVVG
jgi:hypothetical protein